MTLHSRFDEFALALAPPLLTARGLVEQRRGRVIVLTDASGHWGRGEVAPLPGWCSADPDEVLEEVASWVAATDGAPTPAPSTALSPEAAAGVDVALWSLHAAQQGRPLWQAISDVAVEGRVSVPVNALISGSTVAEVGEGAAVAARSGYGTLKVKLGMADDLDRIDAVARAVDASVMVRLDANGAWGVDAAWSIVSAAQAILGDRLDYVEDPVADLDALEELRARCDAPFAVDELVRGEPDLDRVVESGLAEVVVVKPALVGGITPTLRLADLARERGMDVVVSSLYDGPVGLAAWAHLGAALALTGRGHRAHGLATAALFEPGTMDQLLPQRGRIVL